MADLLPLRHSHAADEKEAELYQIFLNVYQDELSAVDALVDNYAKPQLGDFSLIERILTSDDLVLFRDTDEYKMRHVFRAWKHRNPERGFHFLEVMLRTLYGDGFAVHQLWQKKSEAYTVAMRARYEIPDSDIGDWFLTSRVRIDIDSVTVPEILITSLRTAIAARFLLLVRIAKYSQTTLAVGSVLGVAQNAFLTGELITEYTEGGMGLSMGNGNYLATDANGGRLATL